MFKQKQSKYDDRTGTIGKAGFRARLNMIFVEIQKKLNEYADFYLDHL